jgi:hypothetical protein
MRLCLGTLLALATAAPAARAQSAADSSGIRAAALDYAEGWYEGNSDVAILDIFGNAASAKATRADWVDEPR